MDEIFISSIFEVHLWVLGHSGPFHCAIIARCAHSHLIFLLVIFSW
jgi:hypothetical protein